MKFLELFQKELISLAFALGTALIFWLFRARAQLKWGLTHGFTFTIHPAAPPPTENSTQVPAPVPFLVHSRSLILANTGRLPATNVEVILNWRPENFEIFPTRQFEHFDNPDGHFGLRFANIAPKENFQIEILTAHNMPNVLNVRCRESVGQSIPIRPTRVLPKWLIGILFCLMFLGLAAVFYIVLRVGALFLN